MNIIDEVKSRLDIVEVAGEELQLLRSGVNWKARCPFHDDKTPSLVVFPGSQRWACFGSGCNQGGDLIDLVQRKRKWDFATTLRYLAQRAGVEIKPVSEDERRRGEVQQARQAVFGAAMAYFQGHLLLSAGAAQGNGRAQLAPGMAYALGRGWTRETLLEAGIGSLGNEREGLRRHLQQAGLDPQLPAAVALLGKRGQVREWAQKYGVQAAQPWLEQDRIPGMPPDMLVYPHLERGRVAYLAGRAIAEKRHWNPPRELVGPRHPYYNTHWWRADLGEALLVEGQGDALTLAQWGIPAVALAGCSLSSYQGTGRGAQPGEGPEAGAGSQLARAILHKAKSSRILIALDADPAGEMGTLQVAEALCAAGLKANQIGLVRWPAADANAWLQGGAGAEQARQLLRGAGSWMDELIDQAARARQGGPALEDQRPLVPKGPLVFEGSLVREGPLVPKGPLVREGLVCEGPLVREGPLQRAFEALAEMDAFEQTGYLDRARQVLKISQARCERLLRAARIEKEKRAASSQVESQAEKGIPFRVVDGCIWRQSYSSKGELTLDRLSNFEARIEQEMRRDDGQEIALEFRLVGQVQGQRLSAVRVLADEFERMDWVVRKWGARLIIEPGRARRDQLRAAIQFLSKDIEQREVFTHTGWRELGDSGRAYLSGSGALGMQGVEVDLDSDLRKYRLPQTAQAPAQADAQGPAEADAQGLLYDPVEAMKKSLQFIYLAPFEIITPLWGAIWLAPLRELVHANFVLWLYGRTGTLKSSLAALALNHYGAAFDGFQFPANFSDTPGRLEHKAFLVKDALLVIDDYAPQKNPREAQEYRRAASHIIRAVGNQAGRGRLTREIKGRVSYAPRGVVVATGEDIPDTESLLARLFVVEFKEGSLDKERLSALQKEREAYPHAMAGYLGWVREHWQAYKKILPPLWEGYRQKAMSEGAHLRLPESAASLMVGWEMGLRYALSIEALRSQDYKQLLDLGWSALVVMCREMKERASQEKPEELFINTLRELLAQGKICLRQRGGPKTLGGPEDRAEMLGWYDESHLYLLPEAAYARVARHFRDQGSAFPVRQATLRMGLKEAGWLVEKYGRTAPAEWLESKLKRVLVLKRAALIGNEG